MENDWFWAFSIDEANSPWCLIELLSRLQRNILKQLPHHRNIAKVSSVPQNPMQKWKKIIFMVFMKRVYGEYNYNKSILSSLKSIYFYLSLN